MTLRCAAYARYSNALQSPSSIEDQLRKCREYSTLHGFQFLDQHVYIDQAISGVGSDRPGLRGLMAAAVSEARPFDVILVDDSSRLSRDTKDALGIFGRLNFAGIRLIAVSQGIDSQDEQAQVLVTVHGMVDSLYVKELAKKTHRGLEGLVLKGRHAGGRTFGYPSSPRRVVFHSFLGLLAPTVAPKYSQRQQIFFNAPVPFAAPPRVISRSAKKMLLLPSVTLRA